MDLGLGEAAVGFLGMPFARWTRYEFTIVKKFANTCIKVSYSWKWKLVWLIFIMKKRSPKKQNILKQFQ